MTTAKKAPWEKPNPRKTGTHKHLTETEKKAAKARAKRAGRPYPNLVDNMHEAAKKRDPRKS